MQGLQNVQLLRQMAMEHEARLRRHPARVTGSHPMNLVRRWLGGRLVRLGAWVGTDPTMRPAPRIGA